MSYIEFEELKSKTLSEQISYLEEKIQSVKKCREHNVDNIRHLEEYGDNLNQQIEALLEMKWNCKTEKRIGEVMDKAEEIIGGELSENEMGMLNGNIPANKINNNTMEQNYDHLSLYDYLGKAAGQKLGEEVNKEAQKQGVRMVTKDISNHVYTGKVQMYPVEFLDEYFKG
jgi:hypothetical protein